MGTWSGWCETLGSWMPSTGQSQELEIRLGLVVQALSSFLGCSARLWGLLSGPLDIILMGGAVSFVYGVPVPLVTGGINDGLYLFQMPFLDLSHSFSHGMGLLLDEGLEPNLLSVTGDH